MQGVRSEKIIVGTLYAKQGPEAGATTNLIKKPNGTKENNLWDMQLLLN